MRPSEHRFTQKGAATQCGTPQGLERWATRATSEPIEATRSRQRLSTARQEQSDERLDHGTRAPLKLGIMLLLGAQRKAEPFLV